MGPGADDFTVLEHHDLVGIGDRGHALARR
jgi:hypothetical protein